MSFIEQVIGAYHLVHFIKITLKIVEEVNMNIIYTVCAEIQKENKSLFDSLFNRIASRWADYKGEYSGIKRLPVS